MSFFSLCVLFAVISPKPIDQEPEQNFVGVIIAILTTIILLLIAIILFIIAKNKRNRRADVLGTMPHSLHQDGLNVDKRAASNIKVSISDMAFIQSLNIWLNQGGNILTIEEYKLWVSIV